MADLWQSFLDAPFVTQAGVGLALLVLFWGLWQLAGRGPRRRRRLASVRKLLSQGNWSQALALLPKSGSGLRRSPFWNAQFEQTEAEGHELALAAALKEKDFEAAADRAIAAARCRNKSETAARWTVIEGMLQEARRLFSEARGADTTLVHGIISRVFRIQPNCSEASFWEGLCHLREDKQEAARQSLETARAASLESAANDPKRAFLDPPLYLGALLMRAGKPKEALRYFTEANRIDARSPFVGCSLGSAMVAAGGDATFAVRALERALGPQGFERWVKNPERAWAEGLPEANSFVCKLAKRHPFQCPVWSRDARALRHEGYLALGQAFHRLNDYSRAKAAFEKLIHETAPTYAALRGLGLSLARLGQYDEAFTHLKTAHDMEEVKDRITAGYLALCGAKAKPTSADDKARNILWAIRLLTRFQAVGDAEWARIVSDVFAEARQASVPLNQEDQSYLRDHLVSVAATDSPAAEAYHHLMATFPTLVKPEVPWLYGRAAHQYSHTGPSSLALFARIFGDATGAHAFYSSKEWDLEAVELTYLRRAAEQEPGKFPESLGPDYAQRGEKLLLERSKRQEEENDLDGSLATAEILLALSPQSGIAHDRAAQLYYRKGSREQAVAALDQWHARDAGDPTPLIRSAAIHHELGNAQRADEHIDQALRLTQGHGQADIAFLGARLCLKASKQQAEPGGNGHEGKRFDRPLQLLNTCLEANPKHAEALSLLAALRWTIGDTTHLAEQADAMSGGPQDEPRQRYFSALAHLVAGQYERALELCQIAPTNAEHRNGDSKADLSSEMSYLAGWAAAREGDSSSAIEFLAKAAKDGPSANHARALAGKLSLLQGKTEEALSWWKSLDTEAQKRWRIDEALAGTVFSAALESLGNGQYEQAADRIREAGRLGCRDRRLGSLLTLALVKAGQKLMYARAES